MEEVNNRLDEWRLALGGKILRISWSKIEYIEYDFGRRYQEFDRSRGGGAMTISGVMIGKVENLKYLGSLRNYKFIQKNESFGVVVNHWN